MQPESEPGGGGPVDESVREPPGIALRPMVGWYSGYRQAGVPAGRHRGLPSPYLTLILTLDDPLTVLAHPDPGQVPGDFRLLLGGLHTAPALIGHDGRQSGVQIALDPLGARALLGIPAGELAEIDVSADDVLGRDIVLAQERLRAAKDWLGRFAVVDDWLAKRAAKSVVTAIPAELTHAWRLLRRSNGTVPIADLASELGWSARRLSGRFSAEFGLTPKAAARVIRFDRVRRRLADRARRGPVEVWPDAGRRRGLGLAGLAVDAGYYDQAHLDREFNALAGCPPVAWLAEEFRNIQSGAVPGEGTWNRPEDEGPGGTTTKEQ
ncbi:AraC family transcriptional regulator [Catenulispora sp. NL8]|uniref:AraC family transcriptional regulator n=1 Tax=Catenulispora pinistramenti TaxID=2705254 RepID=A0ABS5L452_9ACTN|nr:helix-turn-helix domain-containing protein [Catenulispora pinistramenti]MBS2553143.1 AraC family transcriptional regulator [Catenulispora pinistramenti]